MVCPPTKIKLLLRGGLQRRARTFSRKNWPLIRRSHAAHHTELPSPDCVARYETWRVNVWFMTLPCGLREGDLRKDAFPVGVLDDGFLARSGKVDRINLMEGKNQRRWRRKITGSLLEVVAKRCFPPLPGGADKKTRSTCAAHPQPTESVGTQEGQGDGLQGWSGLILQYRFCRVSSCECLHVCKVYVCVCVWHSEQTVFDCSLENGRQIVTHSWVDRYRRTSERKSLFSMCLKLTRSFFCFTFSYMYLWCTLWIIG